MSYKGPELKLWIIHAESTTYSLVVELGDEATGKRSYKGKWVGG